MSGLLGLGRSAVCRRGLATSVAAGQLVKTPIQVHGVEGRYASALYSAASKQKSLEAVEKQLAELKGLYHSDAKFRRFVQDPTLKKSDKKAAMEAICSKLGHSALSGNFFGLVAENGRLGRMEGMVKAFETLMAAHRGEVECSIISAQALDAKTTKELEQVLKTLVPQGASINLTTSVDPTLLGGLIVNVGDKYVDMSIASKLNNYEKLISAAV